MTLVDLMLIAALAAFLGAWWWRALPGRPAVLVATASAALGLGLYGVVDDRWQDGVGAIVALIALLVLLANRLRNAPARTAPPFISGGLFGLLALTAVGAIWLFPVSPLPKPSGPNPVGVRSFELDDASRPGVFAAKPGEPRRLLVRVWYPASNVSGRTPAPYFSEREADTTAAGSWTPPGFPPALGFAKHVRTNSYPDAPLIAGPSRLPVVFYSHGYGAFLQQNTVLMEHLASHGYVVFSVQHTYDSGATVFPSGEVAPVDKALARRDRSPSAGDKAVQAAQRQALVGATPDERLEGFLRMRELQLGGVGDRLLKSGEVWAADRIFVHDQLQRGAVPSAIREIAAAGDLTRVGEMGMSFGGAISGAICMRDRRCAAGINLDGGDFPFQAFARDVPVPFMMFHSDLGSIYKQLKTPPPKVARSFNEFSYEGLASAGARRDIYRVALNGAQHLGLSDFSLFVRRPARDPILGTTPAKVMIGAQNDFVLGFFDRHLRGIANAFPKPEQKRHHRWVAPLRADGVRAWWLAKSEPERADLTARIERARAAPRT